MEVKAPRSFGLDVFERVHYPIIILCAFTIFFINGYIVHGCFLGFKPLDFSQVLIVISLGCFISIPMLFYAFSITAIIETKDEIKNLILNKDTSGIIQPNKDEDIGTNVMYFITALPAIYLFDLIIFIFWINDREPLINNISALLVTPIVYVILWSLLSTIILIQDRECKKLTKEYGEFLQKSKKD